VDLGVIVREESNLGLPNAKKRPASSSVVGAFRCCVGFRETFGLLID
jgi:hypothetical protein